MSWSDRTIITEQRVFKWEEVKKLKKRELYHLFIESAITGWDTVAKQKRHHAKQRAANPNPEPSRANCWEICWECEAIFKKLKPPQENEYE